MAGIKHVRTGCRNKEAIYIPLSRFNFLWRVLLGFFKFIIRKIQYYSPLQKVVSKCQIFTQSNIVGTLCVENAPRSSVGHARRKHWPYRPTRPLYWSAECNRWSSSWFTVCATPLRGDEDLLQRAAMRGWQSNPTKIKTFLVFFKNWHGIHVCQTSLALRWDRFSRNHTM